jgi:hypothetical protein
MLKDLKTLGVKTDDPDFSLALIRPGSPIWDGCLGAPYELAVVESKKVNDRTGKPYVNLYLNERLGGPLTLGRAERHRRRTGSAALDAGLGGPDPVRSEHRVSQPFHGPVVVLTRVEEEALAALAQEAAGPPPEDAGGQARPGHVLGPQMAGAP